MRPSAGRSPRRPGRSDGTGSSGGRSATWTAPAGGPEPPGRLSADGGPSRAAARRTARWGRRGIARRRQGGRRVGRARGGPSRQVGWPAGRPVVASSRGGRRTPSRLAAGLAAGWRSGNGGSSGIRSGFGPRSGSRPAADWSASRPGPGRTVRPRGSPRGRSGRCHPASEAGGSPTGGRPLMVGPATVGPFGAASGGPPGIAPAGPTSPAGPAGRGAGCGAWQSARTGQHLGHRAARPLERQRDRRAGEAPRRRSRDWSRGRMPYRPPWTGGIAVTVRAGWPPAAAGSPEIVAAPAGKAAAAAAAARSPRGHGDRFVGRPAGWVARPGWVAGPAGRRDGRAETGETRLVAGAGWVVGPDHWPVAGGRLGLAAAIWVRLRGLRRRRGGSLARTRSGREPAPDRPSAGHWGCRGRSGHRGVTRPSIDRVVDRGDRLHPHWTGRIGGGGPFGASERKWAHPASARPITPATNCRFMIRSSPSLEMADRHGLAAPIGLGSAVGGPPGHLGNPEFAPLARPGGPTRSLTDREHMKDRRPAVEKGKTRWTWIAATRNLTPIAGECKGDSEEENAASSDRPSCPASWLVTTRRLAPSRMLQPPHPFQQPVDLLFENFETLLGEVVRRADPQEAVLDCRTEAPPVSAFAATSLAAAPGPWEERPWSSGAPRCLLRSGLVLRRWAHPVNARRSSPA